MEGVAAPPRKPASGSLLSAIKLLLGAVIALWPVLWTLDPFDSVSRYVLLDQFAAIELGAALSYLFAGKLQQASGTGRVLNLLFLASTVAMTVWLVNYFGSDDAFFIRPTPALLVTCAAALVLTLVAGWKASGSETVLMILGFLVFGYVAQYLPIWMGSPPVKLDSYLTYMVFGANGVMGQALKIISSSVIVFLLFGTAFELSGGTRAIGALALLMARFGRGAAISVCIIASALFGTISGSATSNVLAAGSFSIPGMKRMGVSPAKAAGIEAVASTIGQVMPPVMGAAAFIMANMTGFSYSQVALASVVPALLCYLALFLQGEMLGRRIGKMSGRVELEEEHTSLGWSDLLHFVPVAGLVWALVTFPLTPELSGVVGTFLALLVALLRKGFGGTWRDLKAIWPKAGTNIASLTVTASTVGIILGVIASTGLDVQLTLLISNVGQQNLFFSLILASVTAFILGLGVGTAGVYIVAGSLLAPGLIGLGVPIMAAHLFVLYSAMLSMITPPVAFASLTAAGLAGAGFYETSNEAMKFGWALFLVPFLIAYSPELVLVGDGWVIAGTIVSVSTGVVVIGLFCFGGERRFPRWGWDQWVGLIGGIALIIPAVPLAFRAAGAGVAMVVLIVRWVLVRPRPRAAA